MAKPPKLRRRHPENDPLAAYARSLNLLLAGVRPDAPCRQSADPLKHDWYVFTTYLQDVSLGVFCVRCGCDGIVPRPGKGEWGAAWSAPSNPYPFGRPAAVRYINDRLDHWRREAEELGGSTGPA